MANCIVCKADIDLSYRACPRCGEPVTEFLRQYLDKPIDGKYRLLERLGAGGMGEVYKVEHIYLGATRVIKVIRPQISSSQDIHDRFLREARMATKVQHPNVATLHDFSALPDGSHYMVWEFIEGQNLAQRLSARGFLPPHYAVGLMIQALRGLEAIHNAGIVHRDISPENLMITREKSGHDRVRIIDLGVAKIEDPDETATRAGVFVGKLRYASPEHVGFLEEGEKLDGRADLYSIGVVLYEAVAGRPPFQAKSPHEYFIIHSQERPFQPVDLRADLPGGAALQDVLRRALARDRNKRFPTAGAFIAALEEVSRALPDSSEEETVAGVGYDPAVSTAQLDRPQRAPQPRPATARTDTLHRPTERGLAVPTAPGQRVPAPRPSRRYSPILFLSAAIFLVAIGIGLAALYFAPRRQAARISSPATQSQPPMPPPRIATSVEVAAPASSVPLSTTTAMPTTTAATTTTAMTTTTAATTTTAEVMPARTTTVAAPTKASPPPPIVRKETPPPPTVTREPVRRDIEEPVPVGTYVEGDESEANEQRLEDLRRELQGVDQIAVRAAGGDPQFVEELKRLVAEYVTVSDSANVVIRFDGSVERLGVGRKRRSAEATVIKGGRVIFRYRLGPETYRVGDNPAEAFVRVLSDAFD